MQQRLIELWYREQPRVSLLQPLAWLYAALVALRQRAYLSGLARGARAGKPVVVVGNLTVGGTGKTPLVIWLAQALAASGLRVGIVARGYGGRRENRAPRRVRADSPWQEVGDESLLLARRSGCPTVVGIDRLAAARALAAEGVDLIVSDDGLQHLRLARDCEIVVIDGARGFGNGRLLPAGPLREPLRRLRRVDAVVVNGSPARDSLAALLPAPVLAMRLEASEAVSIGEERRRPLTAFRGTRVHGVAGIGNPQRFFAELRAQGLEVTEHAFPDHHALTAPELAFGDDLPVLMTEKDAVKCTAFVDPRLWYVPVTAQLATGDAHQLLARVLAKVRGTVPTGGS